MMAKNNYQAEKGQALYIGELVDSRPMQAKDVKKAFVEFRPDLFCHVYENVFPIDPIPWKGVQRWKKLTERDRNKIMLL